MTDLREGTLVRVYRNLQRDCWSVQGRTLRPSKTSGTGYRRGSWKVIAHLDALVVEDARFRVSEAGRRRVLAERRKNVHAWVEGVVAFDPLRRLVRRVRYDPYEGPEFVDLDGNPVREASAAYFTVDGCVYVREEAL